MFDNYDWPVPTAPTIDHVLRDLTEHAGCDVAANGVLDQTFAAHPNLIGGQWRIWTGHAWPTLPDRSPTERW